jgi:class 3 adenylate cyclase
VLFTDVVGYSRLLTDQQREVLRRLWEVIRGTEDFRGAQAGDRLISLPTGDGMALVFFGDALAPLRCAQEIGRALRAQPDIGLRMGLNSGPVFRVEDINAHANVAGEGINTAQRVMDCGDAGHILLSKLIADYVAQVSGWAGSLHDLGEVKVKHGVKLHLFNFHTGEVGNPEVPSKLRSEGSPVNLPETGTSEVALAPSPGVAAEEARKRVVLLYTRNSRPDDHVLRVIEDGLRAQGHDVFVDRHLSIGMEWAKEIEHRVRTADAVIPLLSAASVHSEMLAYEVQIAHEAAQHEPLRPRILPVRVAFEESLPDPIGSILAPLHHTLWAGNYDDRRLVEQLQRTLHSPSTSAADVKPPPEPPGGVVPLDSKYYVLRPTDGAFLDALERRDSIVLLKGARQMGKTSLLARGLQRARSFGARVVMTDLQKLNSAQLESIEEFFLALGQMMADRLGLKTRPDEVWSPRSGASINFERYVWQEVLNKISEPLVWGLDEVDRLFTCSFGSEVFGLFRAWHNERALEPESPWDRLTLAIAYATEAHLFITDPNQSPFNVGTRLELKDFTPEQTEELNERHGPQPPLRGAAEVLRFYELVGGHPYLARRGLHEMVTQGVGLGAFEKLAERDEGPLGDHLRRILVLLARDPELYEAVRSMLRGHSALSPQSFYRLRSAGVISGDSEAEARPRCRLYETYLKRHLL